MTEHRIQLRKVWAAEVGTGPRTIDLPATWSRDDVPHRLARKFHAPRSRDPEDSVFLVVEDVPGLVSASLNGRDLGIPPEAGVWEVSLSDRLGPVNELVLHLNHADVPSDREWGRIALAIRS